MLNDVSKPFRDEFKGYYVVLQHEYTELAAKILHFCVYHTQIVRKLSNASNVIEVDDNLL